MLGDIELVAEQVELARGDGRIRRDPRGRDERKREDEPVDHALAMRTLRLPVLCSGGARRDPPQCASHSERVAPTRIDRRRGIADASYRAHLKKAEVRPHRGSQRHGRHPHSEHASAAVYGQAAHDSRVAQRLHRPAEDTRRQTDDGHPPTARQASIAHGAEADAGRERRGDPCAPTRTTPRSPRDWD